MYNLDVWCVFMCTFPCTIPFIMTSHFFMTAHKRIHTGVRSIATQDEWDEALVESKHSRVAVFVQFTGKFCQPCKRIAPFFDSLASSQPGIFIRVDIEELPDLALGEGVGVIPAFHCYKDGKLVESMRGDSPEKLHEFTKRHS